MCPFVRLDFRKQGKGSINDNGRIQVHKPLHNVVLLNRASSSLRA
jgi:hypothetical protein